jgi:RNA polymerase sigma-70 factor (ECF subfamily)
MIPSEAAPPTVSPASATRLSGPTAARRGEAVAPAASLFSGDADDAERLRRNKADQRDAERTLAGDKRAFAEIVARRERGLYRHVLRLVGSAEEAEDIVQETFLKAYRGLAGYNPQAGASFSAWLFRIGTNEALSALRRRRPNASLEDAAAEEEPCPAASPARAAESRELAEKLWEAVEELSPESAAMFQLRYREEMSVEEIAEAVGKKPNAVAAALHRAREKLREKLFGSAKKDGRTGR